MRGANSSAQSTELRCTAALVIRGTAAADTIVISQDLGTTSEPANDLIVDVRPADQAERAFACDANKVTSIRVYCGDGDDDLTFDTLSAVPRLRSVNLYGGAGNDTFEIDQYGSLTFRLVGHGDGGNDFIYCNGRASALFGDDGNDTLMGADTGVVLNGGAGDDTFARVMVPDYASVGLGETVLGGDGNDSIVLSSGNAGYVLSSPTATASPSSTSAGSTRHHRHHTPGAILVDGGAGDDLIVGNITAAAGTDGNITLRGGAGRDQIFAYADEHVAGATAEDQLIGSDRFTGTPAIDETATLAVTSGFSSFFNGWSSQPASLRTGAGDNGPGSPIVVTDGPAGTLRLRGPAGSMFTLGQLLTDAGYPLAAANPPLNSGGYLTHFGLTVNGTPQGDPLGYAIQPGDQLALTIGVQPLG